MSMRILPAMILGAACTFAQAETRLDGALPDELGFYRIDLPDGWQPGGPLLVFHHGFDMQAPSADDLPATAPDEVIRQAWLAQGYALAAGSYGSRGWALFDLERAELALLAKVRERAGDYGEVLLFGGSLGGVVALRAAEVLAANGQPAAGVLAACPPAGGARTWDQAVDVRLLYDAVCPSWPLPAGSEPLPWVIDEALIPADLGDINDPDALLQLLSAANDIRKCTGLFQPAFLDTQAQKDRRAQLKALLGLSSDDFLKLQLSYAIYPLADLVRGADKLGGHSGFDNRFVDYGDAGINAAVRRIERDPLAAVKLAAASDPIGAWGPSRVLAIHTDRDELVFPEHLSALQATPGGGRPAITAIVREAQPGHCGFTASEIDVALSALRQWIDHDATPSPASLAADCAARAGSERCAFAADATVANLDSRIRPRALDLDHPGPSHDGAWFDPARSGEGLVVETLADGIDATVTWYSYPPAGSGDEQAWIVGRGRIAADGIHVADAYVYRGARFGDFDPAEVRGERWGELTLSFERCGDGRNGAYGIGRLRYAGPDGFGSGERALFQLTGNAILPEHCSAFLLPQQPVPASRYAGSWFRGPQAAGEGLQFQVDARGFGVLVWYTYSPDGEPAWLIGTAPVPADDGRWRFTLRRPRGTHFGSDFDSAAIVQPDWGSVELRFDDCDHLQLAWTPFEAGWPAGTAALQRLTRLAGSADCGAP